MKKFICAALSLLLVASAFSSCSEAAGDSTTVPENEGTTNSQQDITEEAAQNIIASGTEESTTDSPFSTEAEASSDMISYG